MITIRLNDFLYNSGVLGFYRILEHRGKLDKIRKQCGNEMEIEESVFDNFEEDYINTILDTYEEDTRWYRLISYQEEIENLKLGENGKEESLNAIVKDIKTAITSSSYQSAYETVKGKEKCNAIEEIKQIEKVELEEKKNRILQIIEYLKKNRETYAMKDIMYNKISDFWQNVSFLNKNNNKKDIKEEYKSYFIDPIQKQLEKKQNSEYRCIECGSLVGKSNSFGMSWLADTGVNIKKKNNAFWNYQEDAFLCPVCNLIYSCVPLGFYIVGKNGIFINQNNSIESLVQGNDILVGKQFVTEQNLEKIEQNIFSQLTKQFESKTKETIAKNEIHNIQVIKRIRKDKDKNQYEFNTISKEKLRQFMKIKSNFEHLINKRITVNKVSIDIYEEVMQNFVENKNQYKILDMVLNQMINNRGRFPYLKDILEIQINSIGGMNVEKEKELKTLKEEIERAGESLQAYFFIQKENENKLKAYILKLSNSLRTNNVNMFMDIVTRMYGGIGKKIPATEAFVKMITNKKYFRSLGYAYVIGLEGFVKGGNKGEE